MRDTHVHPVKNRAARVDGETVTCAAHLEIGMNIMLALVVSPVQWVLATAFVLVLFSIGPLVLGSVFIRERQVGIVIKKFGRSPVNLCLITRQLDSAALTSRNVCD